MALPTGEQGKKKKKKEKRQSLNEKRGNENPESD